jgi:hypothetical protein
MKRFIIAAALYALCGAQGAFPSTQIYGAFASEQGDVHDLVIELLNSCPALALPGTSQECVYAPVCTSSSLRHLHPKMTEPILYRPRLQTR